MINHDIGDYEHMCDESMVSFDIAPKCKSIGEGAFYDCSSLEEICIPSSVKVIKDKAFGGCTSLGHLVLAEGLEEIGAEAFVGCTSLEEVVIPISVKTIAKGAFKGCTSLRVVKMTENLQELQDSAFEDCTALEEVTVPSKFARRAGQIFNGCGKIVKQIAKATLVLSSALTIAALIPDKAPKVDTKALPSNALKL